MARIAVTGAAGNVGREVLRALDDGDHEAVPFTHSETDEVDGDTLEVTDREEVLAKVADVDAVVHLAGASSPDADWETVLETNVRGTKHVFDAAVENGVDRVVFASSNHAVGTYNQADPADPESMRTDGARAVDGDAAPRPDSHYGVSKVAGEAIAARYAARHGLEAVNLRIGWYLSEADLREQADADPENARFARAMWLSPRDCRDVHLKAATADLPDSPLTLNAVSGNAERTLSLTETMLALDYRPRDDASEVLDGA